MAVSYRLVTTLLTLILICAIFIVLNNIFEEEVVCTGPNCVENKGDISSTKSRNKSKLKLVTRIAKPQEVRFGSKKIIYLYGNDIWNKYDKFTDFDWRKCQPQYSKCQITTESARIPDSDAVVYNSLQMPTDEIIDKHKYRQFKRVFLSGTTPLNTTFDTKNFENFFDYSITYKSDSDIRIPYWPNDGMLPAMYRPKISTKFLDSEAMLDLEDDVKSHFERYGKESFLSYTIKNCTAGLYNNLFVGKLREEGNIDIFTIRDAVECMNIIKETAVLPCNGFHSDDCVKHFEKYKFLLLADENLCVDYTTRDYWYAILAWKSVPLLYGAGDYKKHLIPNSYIDCVGNEDYVSPSFKKAHEASQKSIDYYKTFQMWRHEDRIETYYWQCELCQKLSSHEETNKLNMNTFWNKEKDCGKSLDINEKMRLQLVRTGVLK